VAYYGGHRKVPAVFVLGTTQLRSPAGVPTVNLVGTLIALYAQRCMNCCYRCFAHPWLGQFIIANSQQNGDCPFCGARAVPLIPLAQIAHRFDAMMSLYNELNADTILDFEDPLSLGRHSWPVAIVGFQRNYVS
jgi:hypothetical protein